MTLLTSRLARLSAVTASLAMAALAGLSVSANAQVVNSSNAQVAKSSNAQVAKSSTAPAATRAPGATFRPNAISLFTVGVKCGWWNGSVQWGGIGIYGNPGYIIVTGTVHSSCNSKTYVYIKYTFGGSVYPYGLFAKTGPKSSAAADVQTQSITGPYGNIYIKVCSNRYGWTCKAHKA